MFTFMDAWARPVFEAAKTLLDLAMNALRGQDDLAKRDLAVLYQRVNDDAARAYSLAFNATEGLDGSPSPQAAVGDFHRDYQAMVTWIGKGIEHAVLHPDSIWYREWYASDARFMDELHQTAARPGRSALRENLRAAGFNEGVRHKLPAPGPRLALDELLVRQRIPGEHDHGFGCGGAPAGDVAARPAATEHGPPGPRSVSWFRSRGQATTSLPVGMRRRRRRS